MNVGTQCLAVFVGMLNSLAIVSSMGFVSFGFVTTAIEFLNTDSCSANELSLLNRLNIYLCLQRRQARTD